MNKIISKILGNPLLLDIQSGITAAKNEAINTVKFLINDVAIPLICVVLVGLFVFAVAKCGRKHREGEDYSKNIIAAVVIIVILALVASAPTWIWTLIG